MKPPDAETRPRKPHSQVGYGRSMRGVLVMGALMPALMAGGAYGAQRPSDTGVAVAPAAVGEPARPPCRERLSRRGAEFTRGPAARGVANPVTVALPLAGIAYHRPGDRRPQHRLYADCSLVLALHQMGKVLRSRGIDSVEHLGIYEYRCIEATSPCELSRHASATAIDLHEFRGRRGRSYNVERDWVRDPDEVSTCSASRRPPRNRFLHRLACRLSGDRIFNIVLTPNFNAAHRDHFHVDLTPGEHFIR